MLYIKRQALTGVAEIKAALQNAIRLEFSTIPPYLCAYFTLKRNSPGARFARGVVRNIVVEEMLHMTLAANILNAIGGSPVFNDPAQHPVYPGPLPMGIGDDGAAPERALVVGLKRYSRELVGESFMKIEEPEHPLPLARMRQFDQRYQTIGEFYRDLQQALRAHSSELTFLFNQPSNNPQVRGFFQNEVAVLDVESATRAIEIIIDQGEGVAASPLDEFEDVAHYYRFLELFQGKQIDRIATAAQGKVVLDPTKPILIDDVNDVVQMADNPQLIAVDPAQLPTVAQRSDECDLTYTRVLNKIHAAFNGSPNAMGEATGLMFELSSAADNLLGEILPNGMQAGPSFRYLGANVS
jgi:hypothetical protein